MAESNYNKKKRIARIGNLSSAQGASNLQNSDEAAFSIYNIMESMNKSQNAMSYNQLQEFRSKEKLNSRTNDADKSSLNNRTSNFSSKQTKKFIAEKTFPLMAKCQKSMNYLKKNRCIAKPRAHVGSLPRKPTVKQNSLTKNISVSSSSVDNEERSLSLKRNSKKSECSPVLKNKRKKTKISHSSDNTFSNITQTESHEDTKFISDADSDNEFELFLRKQREKCNTSDDSYSSVPRRKTKKRNKSTRKNRNSGSVKKVSKITRKILSESEDSSGNEICAKLAEFEDETELKENNDKTDAARKKDSMSRQPPQRFQISKELANSDDGVSNTFINDSGTLINYSSSSEDENLCDNLPNKNNVNDTSDTDFSDRIETPKEPNSASLSTSLSELKNIPNNDKLKSKCETQCFVMIRDVLLDQKAAHLQTENSSMENTVSPSNLSDDDDCVILDEASTQFINQGFGNIKQSNASKNVSPRESMIITESHAFKITTEMGLTQTSEEPISNCNITNQTVSKPTVILCNDKNMSLDTQMVNKLTGTVTALKTPLNIEDECSNISYIERQHDINVASTENEKSESLVCQKTQHTSALQNNKVDISSKNESIFSIEKEQFNVQILSVKSLHESDIILLTDDESEEKETETITKNETNENAADSDVEIICLDSSICKKSADENVEDVQTFNNDTPHELDDRPIGSSNSSLTQPMGLDEDCVILNDVHLLSEKFTNKILDKKSQHSESVDRSNIDTNLSKNEKTIASNEQISSKSSILKILDTIDFNCIKKVLSETLNYDQKVQADSISFIAENALCGDIQNSGKNNDLIPEKMKIEQNDIRMSQKQTSLNAPLSHSDVNINVSNVKAPVDAHEEHSKLLQISNASPKIFNNSEKVRDSTVRSCSSSNSICDVSSISNSSNISVAKSELSEKKVITSSIKPELNTLSHMENYQQFPAYPEQVSYNPFDELDILAAKSIQNLDEKDGRVMPLLELYRAEYKKYEDIKCTEKNVTAGLKLLEEKQTTKLILISSSIKNLVKNDLCFHKLNNEHQSKMKEDKKFIQTSLVKKDDSWDKIVTPLEHLTQSSSMNSDNEKDDKIKIFHPSIVERTSEVLESNSVGSSSSQEVYNHLINSVCAECGERAFAACLGCAKVYYCSERCGMSFWSKGHYVDCKK